MVVVVCLLAACADPPMAPEPGVDTPAERPFSGHPESFGSTPTLPEAVPDSMRAWFAERGVTLPEKLAPRPAAKAASDHERLLGDGNGDGKVDYWDLLYLWGRLTKGYTYSWVDWDLLDIDRDDDTDFDDLAILGKHLYESPRPPNTYRPGKPPPRPAAKTAQTGERLLGDGDVSGYVNFWDLFYLMEPPHGRLLLDLGGLGSSGHRPRRGP